VAVELTIQSAAALVEVLASRVDTVARRTIEANGRFAVALPGGSVATTCFPRFSKLPIDWSHVEFFWGDERAVPADDPESNYGLAARLWLGPARVPAVRIHPLPANATDLSQAARDAEQDLTALLGEPPVLDLVLLGMGPDGHVCSLFPGHPLLAEEQRWVAGIEDSPKPPSRRLTLTLPTLAAAGLVIVVATGASKAAAIRDALRTLDSPLPVAMVARRARQVLFALDDAAARLL
jgi:6-phosphogluconolactonase